MLWIAGGVSDMSMLKYLNENLGAANVKLSSEEIASLRKICEESVSVATFPTKTSPPSRTIHNTS